MDINCNHHTKMRKLTIAFFLMVSGLNIKAQDDKHTVEVRLKLLEQKNSKGVKELALAVSFINHSNRDIYIPNFALFASYSGIHVYQKEEKIWREIDIDRQDYYYPLVLSKPIVKGDTIFNYDVDRPVYTDDNDLTKSFYKSTYHLFLHQDSIIKAYYHSAPNHHQLTIAALDEEKPLFLKANEQIDNYLVRCLDYLLTKKMKYKIAFNSEIRDTIKYYSQPRIYSKRLKQYEKLNYPDNIYGYQLFYPKGVIANKIYYTNK